MGVLGAPQMGKVGTWAPRYLFPPFSSMWLDTVGTVASVQWWTAGEKIVLSTKNRLPKLFLLSRR